MKYSDKLRQPQTVSVILIAIGVILLLFPDLGSAAVSAVLGWILVAIGAVGLVIGFFAWRSIGIGSVAGSVLILFGGIWLNNNPLALAKILGILFGVLLLSQGLGSLRDSSRIKRAGGFYRFHLLVGIVTVVLGGFLILSPLSTSRFVMTVTGIIMVACGVSNLISRNRADRFIHDHSIIDAE